MITDLIKMYESQSYANMKEISSELLPNIGYISYFEDKPVAAGFLRLVEGNYGLINSYVTNAELSKDVRHAALQDITRLIIETAKMLNFKGLLVMTSEESIKLRAEATGFHVVDQFVLSLPLKEI